jgi:hypothetical protein
VKILVEAEGWQEKGENKPRKMYREEMVPLKFVIGEIQKKKYLAIIKGALDPSEAIIDMPIERNPQKPQTFRVGFNGKSAVTHYRVIEKSNKYSLVELKPETGIPQISLLFHTIHTRKNSSRRSTTIKMLDQIIASIYLQILPLHPAPPLRLPYLRL